MFFIKPWRGAQNFLQEKFLLINMFMNITVELKYKTISASRATHKYQESAIRVRLVV